MEKPSEAEKAAAQATRYAEDEKLLKIAVANVTFSWAEIENTLCMLLGEIIDDKSMASAILFSPTSLDARIAIVDSAFQAMLKRYPRSTEETLTVLWKRLMKRVSKQKETRNKVAHGSLITQMVQDRAYARLTAPILDTARVDRTTPAAPHRLIGLSAHDLSLSAAAVTEAQKHIAQFMLASRALRQQKGEGAAFAQILRELQDQIRSDPTDPDTQTLPAVAPPPE